MHLYRHLVFASYKSSGKRLWEPCGRNCNYLMFLYIALQFFTQLYDSLIRVEYMLGFHAFSRELPDPAVYIKLMMQWHILHMSQRATISLLCRMRVLACFQVQILPKTHGTVCHQLVMLWLHSLPASLVWCWAFHQLIAVECMHIITLVHHLLL